MSTNEQTRARVATETSPLLSKANSSDSEDQDTNAATFADTGDAAQDGPTDLEDQPEATAKTFEGLPEVKKRMKYILPALSIGIFLAAADGTITVSSYARIGTELHALNSTSWIATAYFMTMTTFQPLYGKLSDIWGRKICLLFAYVTFGLGCLFCGMSQNIQQLIAARAFAGIGAGGMTTVVSIMFSDIMTLRERGKWQGYLNIVFASGSASGAPLGGILVDYVGWRWAFLGQVPLCFFAFVAVYFLIHLPKRGDTHWKEKIARIDFVGAALLLAAVFTLLVALDRGSNVSWKDRLTLINVGLTIPLFATFALVELKVAKEPFAPGRVILSRPMIPIFLCYFFSMAGYISALFYIPLYWQAVGQASATLSGFRLIPNIICSVLGSLLSGLYIQKTGRYFFMTIVAYIGAVMGMLLVLLSTGMLYSSVPLTVLGLSITALCNGIGSTTILIGLIAHASSEDQAIATACSYLFRSLGSVFGVSMSATAANMVVRRSLAEELPKLGLSSDEVVRIADGVRESLQYLQQLKPSLRAVVAECYAHGTSAAFSLELLFIVGCAVSSWFIKEKSLGGK